MSKRQQGHSQTVEELETFQDHTLSGTYWERLQTAPQSCFRVFAIKGDEYFIQDARIPHVFGSRNPQKQEAWLKEEAVKRTKRRIEEGDFEFGKHYVLLFRSIKGEASSDALYGEIKAYKADGSTS